MPPVVNRRGQDLRIFSSGNFFEWQHCFVRGFFCAAGTFRGEHPKRMTDVLKKLFPVGNMRRRAGRENVIHTRMPATGAPPNAGPCLRSADERGYAPTLAPRPPRMRIWCRPFSPLSRRESVHLGHVPPQFTMVINNHPQYVDNFFIEKSNKRTFFVELWMNLQ